MESAFDRAARLLLKLAHDAERLAEALTALGQNDAAHIARIMAEDMDQTHTRVQCMRLGKSAVFVRSPFVQ